MVFVILISIVFVAELIIAFTIIFHLAKFDNQINQAILFLGNANPKIKELSVLIHKISEQISELVPIWVENLKKERDKIILKQTKSLMTAILFWCINIKVIRRITKTKIAKAAWKGLTLIGNML